MIPFPQSSVSPSCSSATPSAVSSFPNLSSANQLQLSLPERTYSIMAHIQLPEGLPGIRGAMAFRPETAKPLNELVEVLLHGPNSLTPGERELIATYVSSENDCYYCQTIHGAIAAASLNDDEALVKKVKLDFQNADISPKLKALLVIAGQVQKGGKHVTAEAVAKARALGATDLE